MSLSTQESSSRSQRSNADPGPQKTMAGRAARETQNGQSPSRSDTAGAFAGAPGSDSEPSAPEGASPSGALPLYPGAPPEVTAHADDWPLPNRSYDNARRARTAIDSRSVAQLQEIWRFALTIDSTAFGYYTANPLILGDVVYVQDMMSNVYALERRSGRVRWSRSFDAATFGPNGVAVGWGKLFAAVGDAAIVALDLHDGTDLWRHEPELGRSEGIDIQPLVYDGQLYAATVPVSISRGVYEGGTHGLLFALTAGSGELAWSFDTIDSQDAWGDPDANGGGGAWYPPLIDAQRHRTYWGTGNPVPWPGSVDQPNGQSRPGPNLYTSSLVAVATMDGTLAWHYQDQPHDIFDWDFQITPLLVPSAVASGRDLVIGAGKTGAVAALDAQSGELLWRTKVGRHENDELSEFPAQSITIYPGVLGGVMSALAYADGVVYVPSVDLSMSYDGNVLVPEISGGRGTLTALDVRDGSVRWTASLRGACYGAATIANDLVFTSDETGRVYAFARDTGDEVWRYDAPGGINAPLAIAGDELLIGLGMDQGLLIALSLHAEAAADAPSGSAGRAAAGGAGAQAPPAAGSGAMGDVEPTFSGVFADVIQRSGCNAGPTCHSSAIAGQLKLSTADEAYAALVGVAAMGAGGGSVDCSTTGLLRVAPGDPDNSLLVQKLQDATPVCGQSMPPGRTVSPEQLMQVRAWIARGALHD